MLNRNKLKNLLRGIVSMKYQIILKHYYSKFISTLEPELEILEFLVKKNDLVNEAIKPFSEHDVIKRHFDILGNRSSGRDVSESV